MLKLKNKSYATIQEAIDAAGSLLNDANPYVYVYVHFSDTGFVISKRRTVGWHDFFRVWRDRAELLSYNFHSGQWYVAKTFGVVNDAT